MRISLSNADGCVLVYSSASRHTTCFATSGSGRQLRATYAVDAANATNARNAAADSSGHAKFLTNSFIVGQSDSFCATVRLGQGGKLMSRHAQQALPKSINSKTCGSGDNTAAHDT